MLVLSHPGVVSFQQGTTGHFITWRITTNSIETLPLYQIKDISGTTVASGLLSNGENIAYCIDNLTKGTYEYTIIVNNGNNAVSDTCKVIVSPTQPQIKSLGDFSYDELTTGHVIVWTVTDLTTLGMWYNVTRNGTMVQSGTSTSGDNITVNVDGLAANAMYCYIINLADRWRDTANNTVMITVIEGIDIPQLRQVTCNVPDVDNSCIQLINPTDESSTFTMQMNGKIFENLSDTCKYITSMPPEFPGEGLQRKAWRFCCDMYSHVFPLSSTLWYSSPEILVDSLGFGWCDGIATTECLIWQALGFAARVWWLSGHVVAEVSIDGNWQMYDADLKIYYYNVDGQVAGVEDLAQNSTLITNPINPILDARDSVYSPGLAQIYNSTVDNGVADAQNFTRTDLMFTLPGHAELSFPMQTGIALTTYDGNTIPPEDYRDCILHLPANFTGKLEIPLVLHAIQGNGTVIIDGQEFQVNSTALQDYINARDNFISQIIVENLSAPLDILLLLNPYLVSLQNQNIINLIGFNIQDLWINVTST